MQKNAKRNVEQNVERNAKQSVEQNENKKRLNLLNLTVFIF